MNRPPTYEASSGDGRGWRILITVALLVLIPIVMFAPRGGDAGPTALRRAPAGAGVRIEASVERSRLPSGDERLSADEETGSESERGPERGGDGSPGGAPPGL